MIQIWIQSTYKYLVNDSDLDTSSCKYLVNDCYLDTSTCKYLANDSDLMQMYLDQNHLLGTYMYIRIIALGYLHAEVSQSESFARYLYVDVSRPESFARVLTSRCIQIRIID